MTNESSTESLLGQLTVALEERRQIVSEAFGLVKFWREEYEKLRSTTDLLREAAEGWKTDALKAQRELAEVRYELAKEKTKG